MLDALPSAATGGTGQCGTRHTIAGGSTVYRLVEPTGRQGESAGRIHIVRTGQPGPTVYAECGAKLAHDHMRAKAIGPTCKACRDRKTRGFVQSTAIIREYDRA